MHAVSRGPAPATFRFALFPFSPATVLFSPAVNHSCPLSLWPLSGCLLRREAISPSPPPLSSFHSGELPPPSYYRIACAEREPFSARYPPHPSSLPSSSSSHQNLSPPLRYSILSRWLFFIACSSSLTPRRPLHNATPAPPRLPAFVTPHTRGSWFFFYSLFFWGEGLSFVTSTEKPFCGRCHVTRALNDYQ